MCTLKGVASPLWSGLVGRVSHKFHRWFQSVIPSRLLFASCVSFCVISSEIWRNYVADNLSLLNVYYPYLGLPLQVFSRAIYNSSRQHQSLEGDVELKQNFYETKLEPTTCPFARANSRLFWSLSVRCHSNWAVQLLWLNSWIVSIQHIES